MMNRPALVMALISIASSALGQGVPTSNEVATCGRGDTGLRDPSGAIIPFARSTNCGPDALAGGEAAVAIGAGSRALGRGALTFGENARATGSGTVALGSGATAPFAGATAIGSGSTATAPNQVALGGAGSSIRVGDIASSTAAQKGPTAVLTVDGNGVIGRDANPLTSVAKANERIDSLFDLRSVDRRDARRGVAAAVAIGQAPMPSATGRTTYVVNAATFRGQQAVGGSIAHRFDTSDPFALTAGFSSAGGRNNAARVGIAGEF